MIQLYWDIGKSIVERQKSKGWGTSIIDYIAKDIQMEFPGISGFSRTNMYRMRSFYLVYSREGAIIPQPVGQLDSKKLAQNMRETNTPQLPRMITEIPWGHNIVLIEKVKDQTVRLWYAQKAIEHGWSRNVLLIQIESALHKRQGKAITNFKRTLPLPQSDLAQQALKDPYIFDFLTLADGAHEQEIEQSMLNHIQRVLLEFGKGFAFVGKQVHIEVGNEDYYLDLLFYHLYLRCYVVIELKSGSFKPEYAGKLNFYLSAVDNILRHSDDKPTIGLLLYKKKNLLTVEYALRNMMKPIGVAEWTTKLVTSLPKNLKNKLPSIAELEKELEKELKM